MERKEFEELVAKERAGIADEAERAALEPYRTKSAIILAAGVGARIAPISYEIPKGLLVVHGEVLIERLIRQLRRAGISDITVVVGYMKESFFYLENEFGVQIRVNPAYADRNNHASLHIAQDKLRDAYVCSSDQYFTENVFDRYALGSNITVVPTMGGTREHLVEVDALGNVTSVCTGDGEGLCMLGPAYFAGDDGPRLAKLIEGEVALASSAGKLWDDIFVEHFDEFSVYARHLSWGVVNEFDKFDDLLAFDHAFVDNVDSSILDNVCAVLDCSRHDIVDIEPISQGLTNLSFKFWVDGVAYVYRHPGKGTDEIINRAAEAHALAIAKRLGLDDTFIYEDPSAGWKISRFIEGCVPFDYRNRDHVARGLALARKLHDSGETSPWSFDFWDEAVNIERLLRDMGYPLPRDFGTISAKASRVAELMRGDAVVPCLCHNDFYGPNFLVRGNDMWLIDWEYAAMGDPACDLGNFVSQGSGYTVEEAVDILPLYYGREPSEQEVNHCLGAIGLVGYYWYVWAIFKEAQGNPVGEWLYIWYKAARDFCAAALARYDMCGGLDA